MVTIGLLWHSLSSSNLGVGALTLSQMAIVERAASRVNKSVQFRVFGTLGTENYGDLPNVVSVCGVERNFIAPWKSPFLSQIRQCDVVLDIGEGDSFTDIYGLERYAHLVGTKLAVWLLGKPLILSPQTIGPFDGTTTLAGACFIMRHSKRVFARDHLSMNYLRSNHISNVGEAIDVAFALPYHNEKIEKSDKVRVGINVSGLLYNGGYTRSNQFGLSLDYAALTHAMLDWFSAKQDCEIYLVSHVVPSSMEVENDFLVCQALQARYPNVYVINKFTNPIDAKSFISTLDFFIGARMHACIAAFSSGVSVVPLAYSRKFNGLFESLSYPYFGDCKKDSLDKVMDLIQDAFQRRSELKVLVDSGNKMAQSKLSTYEDYLVEVLGSIHEQKH